MRSNSSIKSKFWCYTYINVYLSAYVYDYFVVQTPIESFDGSYPWFIRCLRVRN